MIKYKRDLKATVRRMVPTRQRRPVDSNRILLDHLIANLDTGFAFLDSHFRLREVSHSFADIFGVQTAGLSGRPLSDILVSKAWHSIEPYCDDALLGRSNCDIDITRYLPGHAARRAKVTATFLPVNDHGRIAGIAVTVKDASESVLAECEKAGLIAQIHESGAQRRGFLGEMLAALTDGKLRLCETPDHLPPALHPAAPPVELTRDILSVFRHSVIDAAANLKFDQERTGDMVLAVGEALDNVLVHAGGGTAQLLTDAKRGVIQVRMEDSGPGIDEKHLHRAALERGYTTAGTLGHGFYMILHTCDRIWLLTGESGTTLVLEQDKKPPLPAWLSAS